MGEIIDYQDACTSCNRCAHLVQIGKADWMCGERDYVFPDGRTESIHPIKNGGRTEDWNACNKESFIAKPRNSGKRRRTV